MWSQAVTGVSTRTLNILAAVVWHGGGLVLLWKSSSLLGEAVLLSPEPAWPWLAAGLGLVLGGVKAIFLFSKSCRKNLERIAELPNPRYWQFFTPRFFFFLTLMILTGALLSRLAHNNYALLCTVAAVDLTIGVALLGSSYVFWERKAFGR